jgi:hypothetical protein
MTLKAHQNDKITMAVLMLAVEQASMSISIFCKSLLVCQESIPKFKTFFGLPHLQNAERIVIRKPTTVKMVVNHHMIRNRRLILNRRQYRERKLALTVYMTIQKKNIVPNSIRSANANLSLLGSVSPRFNTYACASHSIGIYTMQMAE